MPKKPFRATQDEVQIIRLIRALGIETDKIKVIILKQGTNTFENVGC
jgi:hypothetical protein